MVKELLAHIDYLSAAVDRLDEQIDVMMIPLVSARDRLDTIPGIAKRTAEIIIEEIGVDMSRFGDTRPSGIVGRVVSGEQRVRWETSGHDNQVGEPVVDLRAGGGRLVGIKNEKLLPRCPFLADSETTWPATSVDRDRAHAGHHQLAPLAR